MKRNDSAFTLITVLGLILISLTGCSGLKQEPDIRIHYLGHSAFIIDFEGTIRVLTDFGASRAWGLDSPVNTFSDLCPDILTTSHKRHIDHFGRTLPCDIPHRLSGMDSLRMGKLRITPVRTNESPADTSDNTSFVFKYAGVTIVHLGDAQSDIMSVDHLDRAAYRKRFPDRIDLLLMTIEGPQGFIEEAEAFIRMMHPRRFIPMHYWSTAYKEQFLRYLEDVGSSSGIPYTIFRPGGAEYIWPGSRASGPGIEAVSLDPAPYDTEH